ncbi:MAG: undecaprenyl-diphosphate phosphatase [Alphaproteobacteria bacterium]|nr:undecaprenyl-diphosphate phosphatase [Alphaproteobacteria bacterium]
MSFFDTLLLSFMQSATEFLPVSSSGHLVLMEKFGFSNQSLLMDISLHVGTLFAVIAFFYKDIYALLKGFYRKGSLEQKLVLQLILATIPACVVGFFLSDIVETVLRSPLVIAFTSIFYGILLYVADRFFPVKKDISDMNYKDAFVIGCAQALALVPGTSRSGITMTAARFLGLARVQSAKFSMLMSIPVISLGALYMIYKAFSEGAITPNMIQEISFGIISAGIFGLFAVWFLMRWLRTASFAVFAIYRVLLGICLLFIFL